MHKILHIASAVTVVVSLSLTAASLDAAGAKTVTLTDKDFADKDKAPKVELAKGGKLEVKLKSNPSTGFGWVLASKESPNLKSAGQPKYDAASKGVVGGGGIQVFTFTAVAAGEVELELHYKRSFEKDKPPAETYKIKVMVK